MTHTTIPPKHTVGVELVSAEDAYRAGLPMRPVLAAVERGTGPSGRVLTPGDEPVIDQARSAAARYGAAYRAPNTAARDALDAIESARQMDAAARRVYLLGMSEDEKSVALSILCGYDPDVFDVLAREIEGQRAARAARVQGGER